MSHFVYVSLILCLERILYNLVELDHYKFMVFNHTWILRVSQLLLLLFYFSKLTWSQILLSGFLNIHPQPIPQPTAVFIHLHNPLNSWAALAVLTPSLFLVAPCPYILWQPWPWSLCFSRFLFKVPLKISLFPFIPWRLVFPKVLHKALLFLKKEINLF